MKPKKSKNYNEQQVVTQLMRKADILIKGRQILELRNGKGDVGNGSRGKIDFLVRYRGYTYSQVSRF